MWYNRERGLLDRLNTSSKYPCNFEIKSTPTKYLVGESRESMDAIKPAQMRAILWVQIFQLQGIGDELKIGGRNVWTKEKPPLKTGGYVRAQQ